MAQLQSPAAEMTAQPGGAGLISGPGTGTSDSIPAALSDGEVVIPAEDVRRFGAAQIMALIKAGGQGLPQPQVKEGVAHAAGGGMMEQAQVRQVDNSLAPPLLGARVADTPAPGAVTRVGNSYSGGNVSGSINVNGQAPAGTLSLSDAYKPPAPPPPAGIGATPSATTPPAAVGVRPAAVGAAQQQPMGAAPNGQSTTDTLAQQIAQRLGAQPAQAAPAQPTDRNADFFAAAAARNEAARQPYGAGGRRLGFATGGLVEDPRRALSAYATMPGAEAIGRRPDQFMGMAQEVPRTGLPPPSGASVPAAGAPGGALAARAQLVPVNPGMGQNPSKFMGAADVVPQSRIPATPAAASMGSASRGIPLSRLAGPAGAALGIAAEGQQVIDAARAPGSTGLDVAAQAAQGVGRLGAAGAGAAGGAALGAMTGPLAPIGVPLGAIAGGGLGYLAADRAIAAGRSALGSDPRSPADQLPVAPATPAAPTESGGAVFGIYPRPSSQFSTNANDAALQRGVQATGPSTFVPAAPAEAAPAAAPARLNAATDPRSTAFVAPVAAPDDGAPAAPAAQPAVAPVVAAASSAPASFQAGGTVTDLGGFGVGSAARVAQSGRDQQHLRELGAIQQRIDANNGQAPGLVAIDGAGAEADRRAQFNEGANLRNALARTSWSPRRGTQGDEVAVQAALNPIQQRAALAAQAAQNAGETQRTLIQERATQARTAAQVAQQQEANSIDRARLGIDAIRAGQTGVPSGYRVKPDGTGLEYVPGGPADPNTPKGKNALTEDQAKSAGYAVRMENALKLIGGVAATNPGATRPGLGTALINALPESLANKVRPEDRQRVEAAQLDALDAALTLNTGAAYTKEQLQGLSRAYFAQPGDADKTVAEKQGRLNSLIDTARLRAGASGSTLADTAVQTAQQRTTQPGTAPGPAAAALPAGMSKQIGTSGGKPVYEDAQGRRFIGG